MFYTKPFVLKVNANLNSRPKSHLSKNFLFTLAYLSTSIGPLSKPTVYSHSKAHYSLK